MCLCRIDELNNYSIVTMLLNIIDFCNYIKCYSKYNIIIHKYSEIINPQRQMCGKWLQLLCVCVCLSVSYRAVHFQQFFDYNRETKLV